MKITKVNNQKLAVERELTKQQTGYLYQNKNQGINSKKASEIKQYVSNRARESKRLYSPFVPQNRINTIDKDEQRKFQKFFKDTIFRDILTNHDYDINRKIKALYQLKYGDFTLNSDEAELILRETLRKSLRRKDTYQTLVDIARAVADSKYCSEKLSAIGNERLKQLIDAVMEDYLKKKQVNTIVKSIEHQNVKVQVVKKDGKEHLELANTDSDGGKVLFEELKKYAMGQEQQKTVLSNMNQALVLFYPECEPVLGENYRFNIAEALRLQIGSENNFSEEVQKIFMMNPDRKKAGVDELRTAFLDEVFSRKRKAVENAHSEPVVYWINHIALKLQTKFKQNRALTPGNNGLAYMIEMSWKDMLEYLGKKYIDMGKAVYHFAMPVDYELKNGAVFGEVREEYKQGISSFDYEEIKANETIDRKLSLSVHFAVNQFQNAVSNGDSEILTGKMKNIREDAVHSFLRYFGGSSFWNDEKNLVLSEPRKFVGEVRTYFYYLRNRYYHYNSVKKIEPMNKNGFAEQLFIREQQLVSVQIRKKYYSNNIPMFFSERQIIPIMDKLYGKYMDREAQIPSFNKVVKRKDLRVFYKKWTQNELEKIVLTENRKQYEGMLYFLLKEIYYYGFLTDSSAKLYFDDVVELHRKHKENSKNNLAESNFIDALDEAPNASLAGVCQRIMTQYAMENNRNNLLSERKKGVQKKFDHFPILLYQFLQEAFIKYLEDNQDIYGILKEKAAVKEMPLEETYLSDWKTNMYQKLFESVLSDKNQMAWYLAAHFMPQREVNQLIGCIKSYIQFISDIKTRAYYAKISRFSSHSMEKVKELKNVLEVLDFTLKICLGRFSNEFEDYYWDASGKDSKDIYAEEMANYIEYAGKDEPHKYYVFSNFCKRLSDEETRAVYADEKNPILLKNVELARLFGMKKILPNIVKKVTESDLIDYEKRKQKLKTVFDKHEEIHTKAVQRQLCEFQQKKNHVELHDVLKLAELANDLNSYLVSLAYIRERDLLYYQLGYYYMKLQFSSRNQGILDFMEGPDCSIKKGAALYQVQAMYTYGMELFDKNGCLVDENIASIETGKKVVLFHKKYTQYCEGMALFGQESRMDEAVKVRNSIDHAHFYYGFEEKENARSILELYSAVYDYFFSYDRKLKKSVPVALENILLKYNVEGVLEFGSKQSSSGKCYETDFTLKSNYDRRTEMEYTLKSLRYTYKVKEDENQKHQRNRIGKSGKEKVDIDVCSKEFLNQVEKLLYFRP